MEYWTPVIHFFIHYFIIPVFQFIGSVFICVHLCPIVFFYFRLLLQFCPGGIERAIRNKKAYSGFRSKPLEKKFAVKGLRRDDRPCARRS
jgi:hypothetical protein